MPMETVELSEEHKRIRGEVLSEGKVIFGCGISIHVKGEKDAQLYGSYTPKMLRDIADEIEAHQPKIIEKGHILNRLCTPEYKEAMVDRMTQVIKDRKPTKESPMGIMADTKFVSLDNATDKVTISGTFTLDELRKALNDLE